VAPKKAWPVGEASPSGIAIVNNALFVASLRGTRLYRLVISGSSVGSQTTHFQDTYGRSRTVEPAPDGSLWLTTSGGDKDSTQQHQDPPGSAELAPPCAGPTQQAPAQAPDRVP
jgi:glucose/arabinose dehydrogenase